MMSRREALTKCPLRVCAVTRRRFSSGCKPHPATAPAGSTEQAWRRRNVEACRIAGHELVTRECAGRNASDAEQASHDEAWSRVASRGHRKSPVASVSKSSPFARRGPFPTRSTSHRSPLIAAAQDSRFRGRAQEDENHSRKRHSGHGLLRFVYLIARTDQSGRYGITLVYSLGNLHRNRLR